MRHGILRLHIVWFRTGLVTFLDEVGPGCNEREAGSTVTVTRTVDYRSGKLRWKLIYYTIGSGVRWRVSVR